MTLHKDALSHEAYEKLAEHYFKNVDEKPIIKHYERPGTLALLPDLKGLKVLDASCASGWYSHQFLKQGAEVIGVDFSEEMLKMARRRVGDQATFLYADLNQPLSFEDKSFDVIVSSLTLHYIKDWSHIMNEFFRVLKKGGELIFSIHHPMMVMNHPASKAYFEIERIDDKWRVGNELVEVSYYRRPLSETINAIVQAGFRIEKISEPMPGEAFKQLNQEEYDFLSSHPKFLFVKLSKGL